MDNETLIFVHIPKTAGMTLQWIIKRQYPPERLYFVGNPPEDGINAFERMSLEERGRYRAIVGHVHLGVSRLVPGPCRLFTLLREPVDRVISTYYYIRNTPDHPHYAKVGEGRMSLSDLLVSGIAPLMSNGQTRVLCTHERDENMPYGESPPEALERAKQNLDSEFELVGTVKRFDESLLMLKERFGWRSVYYARRNTSKRRPMREEISPHVHELIREYNRLDFELYRYAAERFDRQVAALGRSFRYRVQLFRQLNRSANAYVRAKTRTRRLLAGPAGHLARA